MQRRDTPTIKTPVGSSIHSAKDHNDTSEGAVHWFQDESGKGLRDSTLFKNLSLLIFYDNHFKKKIRYIFQRSTMEINIYKVLKKKSKIFSLTLHFIYSKILQIKTRTDFLLRFIMESLAPFILSFQNTCQHFLTLSSWYFYVFCNGAIYRSVVWVHV